MRRTLCKVVLAGLQGAKPIQFNRLLTLVAHAGAQSRASPPFRRSTRGLDSITKLLSESSGVDAGNYATKQIFDGIIAGDVKLTDGAVVAALSRAVLLMSGAVKPAPILEALSKFVDIQSHVPDATSSGSLNDVWDAFAEAGLRHPDPTVALSVVSAVVTSRATLSPRVVCGYVDAHRSYLDGLKESTKRRELQASTVGSPRLALSSNSLCGRKSLMLSPPQWGALLDSVKRHCRPAVTSSDCFAIMHILAELGDIKSVFEEFDRFEEVGSMSVRQTLLRSNGCCCFCRGSC